MAMKYNKLSLAWEIVKAFYTGIIMLALLPFVMVYVAIMIAIENGSKRYQLYKRRRKGNG